jgi:phosphatidylinositol alpha-1,6-mannosyltransferase
LAGTGLIPVRLLFVSHCFPIDGEPMSKIGGMQRVAIDLLAQLKGRNDLEVSELLLRTPSGKEQWHLLPFLARAYFDIRRRIASGEVDAVLFSAMPSAVLASVLAGPARRAGVALMAISHGHDVIADFAPYQWLVRRVMHRLDAMLPVSRSTGEQCVERGLPRDKLFVTPNGINPERFGESFPGVLVKRDARRSLLEKQFPALAAATGNDDLLLCSVGRQVKRKGHAWFIQQVMPKLAGNVHLVLGGKGPETATIAQAAKQSALEARIHLLGLVPEEDLAALYSACDLFVMPNIPVAGDKEGFGVVMLEAGLCGMPSIASRIEGIADVITDGKNGFGLPAMDADGFAETINRFAADRSRLDALSMSARQHTLATFTWQEIAGRVADTVRLAVERKRAASAR